MHHLTVLGMLTRVRQSLLEMCGDTREKKNIHEKETRSMVKLSLSASHENFYGL